ncbi:MAG: diguanylate cyclase, partial [Firmicutes bacterium]|nr:diguanylate cyclase [Bacillota bacterium]
MNTNKSRISLKLILYALAYMFFTAIMFAVNIFKLSLHTYGNTLNASDISMIITMILAIITVTNVIAFKKPAYKTAVILFTVHSLFVLTGIIVTRDMTSLVGAVTIIFMFIITTAIYKHVSSLESKDIELRKIAYTDQLTNTPNRRAFNELINSLISSDTTGKNGFALVYIDINEFTQINDAAGHEYGDKVLKEVVARWKYVMKNEDFIARTGGDEFALIIRDFKDENELIEHISIFSNALKNKVTIDDQR